MKNSKRNQRNAIAKAEKLAGGKRLSKYEAKQRLWAAQAAAKEKVEA